VQFKGLGNVDDIIIIAKSH